jgi:hypothetical protein
MNASRLYAQYLLSQRPPKSGSIHLPDYVLQIFASLPFIPSPFKNHHSISPPLLSIHRMAHKLLLEWITRIQIRPIPPAVPLLVLKH